MKPLLILIFITSFLPLPVGAQIQVGTTVVTSRLTKAALAKEKAFNKKLKDLESKMRVSWAPCLEKTDASNTFSEFLVSINVAIPSQTPESKTEDKCDEKTKSVIPLSSCFKKSKAYKKSLSKVLLSPQIPFTTPENKKNIDLLIKHQEIINSMKPHPDRQDGL